MCLTIQDLISDYNQISCPVTLVCAGNRRKEQNQLKKSKGFSWGAGGVSTAIFTGVLMADLIKKARPRRGAKFVCMEGADELVWILSCPDELSVADSHWLTAQWLLWHVGEVELGHGSKPRHNACV